MRKKVIAGNWKMNYDFNQSIAFIKHLKDEVGKKDRNCDIIICPNYVALSAAKSIITDSPIKLGAQNIYFEDSGAFTGETSADMIKSVGCEYVIIGHSERRTIFNESDELINKKIKQALKHKLKPIFCVGETLEEREKDNTKKVVKKQLEIGLREITAEEMVNIIIAYEPVWAIGTGITATPEQAQEVHAYIRNLLTLEYGVQIAENTIIQYGGSVKPENAKDLLSQSDIDGALVGGACLKVDSFIGIIEACHSVKI